MTPAQVCKGLLLEFSGQWQELEPVVQRVSIQHRPGLYVFKTGLIEEEGGAPVREQLQMLDVEDGGLQPEKKSRGRTPVMAY